MTIFDWKFPHVDRKWIWTAITRARDLKKVFFHDYDESAEHREKMMQYLQKKIDNYKYQDKRATRQIYGRIYLTNCLLYTSPSPRDS